MLEHLDALGDRGVLIFVVRDEGGSYRSEIPCFALGEGRIDLFLGLAQNFRFILHDYGLLRDLNVRSCPRFTTMMYVGN